MSHCELVPDLSLFSWVWVWLCLAESFRWLVGLLVLLR